MNCGIDIVHGITYITRVLFGHCMCSCTSCMESLILTAFETMYWYVLHYCIAIRYCTSCMESLILTAFETMHWYVLHYCIATRYYMMCHYPVTMQCINTPSMLRHGYCN